MFGIPLQQIIEMKKIIISLIIALAFGAWFFRDTIQDIRLLMDYEAMFAPNNIDHNFRTVHQQYPAITIPKTRNIYNIPVAIQNDVLPKTFTYEGETFSIQDEIEKIHLTSLLIIKADTIISEQYYRGLTADQQSIMFSCTKSIMSLLIGIAYESGAIQSLEDEAGKYAAELKGTVYEKVTIQNLLDMSSGVQWTEVYDDLDSDVVQSFLALMKGSLNDFTKEMKRNREQGVFNQYTSMDSQVLGMVIVGATNTKLEDYFKDKLWSKLGGEQDVHFLTDKVGFPIAYGGLMMTTRDLAKIGLLMLNDGKNHQGEQLFSPEWIQQSITPDAPHLMAGKDNPNSDYPLGYKNQWWFNVERDGDDFSAIGIYGQTLYVNPARNITIASFSAYPEYNEDLDGEIRRLVMFQEIAKYVDDKYR